MKNDVIAASKPKTEKAMNDCLKVSFVKIADSIAGPIIKDKLNVSVYIETILSLSFLSGYKLEDVIIFGIISPRTKPLAIESSHTLIPFTMAKKGKRPAYMIVEKMKSILLSLAFKAAFMNPLMKNVEKENIAEMRPIKTPLKLRLYLTSNGMVVASILLLARTANVIETIIKTEYITEPTI
jgi:hypothetical protein